MNVREIKSRIRFHSNTLPVPVQFGSFKKSLLLTFLDILDIAYKFALDSISPFKVVSPFFHHSFWQIID